MILHKGVYSACPICASTAAENNTEPQWQIRANTITVDNAEQRVTYHDAVAEVYGVPILYTPYFAHSTPNSDPSSGFLSPRYRTDNNVGTTIITPYYWYISPTMDFTADPEYTTEEGPVLAGQFRQQTPYGNYEFFGSYTHPYDNTEKDDPDNDVKNWRGHIKGDGQFDMTEHWVAGFDGEAASDQTYLQRYNFTNQDLPNSLAYNEDLLTSRVYAERIDDRDYTSIQAVHFQSLLGTDNSADVPNALPYIQNHYESSKGIIPGLPSSVLYGDLSGFNIQREVGANDQRASADTGIKVPLLIPGGQLVEFNGSLRGDQYYMQDDPSDGTQAQRLIPQASAEWRYPLINQLSSTSSLLLEPIVKVVVSPNIDYNRNIPNEDSQSVEFSDLNVFEDNRFTGLDRVESGPRLYYGLRGGYYENDYRVSYLLGQDYRIGKSVSEIPADSGIEDNLSDIVGRISGSYKEILDVSYKFRFDKDNLESRRQEIDTTLNMRPVKLTLSYYNLDYSLIDPTENSEEIEGTAQYYFTDQWSGLISGNRNISEDQTVSASVAALYEGDCTTVLTTVKKDFSLHS